MAIKRMAWNTAHYLGVPSGSTETIYLLGSGIKSLNQSPSPKTTSDAYINDRNASPSITGYDNKFNVDYDDIVDDQAVQALQAIGKEQIIGADAEFNYYRVDLIATPDEGEYPAYRYRVVCVPGDESNESVSVVSASCTLQQVGDMSKGTFNLSTKTFTAD